PLAGPEGVAGAVGDLANLDVAADVLTHGLVGRATVVDVGRPGARVGHVRRILDVVDGEVQAVAGVAPVGLGRVWGRAADDVAVGVGVEVGAAQRAVGQGAGADALAPAAEVRRYAVLERDPVDAVVGGAGVVIAVGRRGPVDVAHAPAAAQPLGALG